MDARILRLVHGKRERRAIQTGQVDAIIDPGTGRAMLLPEAQASLIARKARLRSLLNLSSDGYWEQDEQFRFTLHYGMVIGGGPSDGSGLLGRHLWDLPFENSAEIDWATHRTQLEWRAIIRDLKLRFVDGAGKAHNISISAEPMFDAQGVFNGYCGIVKDDDARGESEIAARKTGIFAHAALDALAVPVCALDAAGTIVVANAAWRRHAVSGTDNAAGMSEGDNYLAQRDELIGDERVDRAATLAGIRQVIAGERELFRYPCYYGTGAEERWALATVTRLRAHGADGALVSHEDVTDARRTEQLLRLEYAVARALAGADTVATALQSVIRTVCEVQRWVRGRYFRLDPATSQLVLEQSWGEPAEAVELVRQAKGRAVSEPGAGLADRACLSQRPHWVLGAPGEDGAVQTALAHEVDLGGAFVFPVLAGEQSLGVLAFGSRSVHAPDEHLLLAVRSIGEQVGVFLLRRLADEAVRSSEADLHSLLELSVDWVWEQDEQFRFTRLDGAGMACIRDILGKALWELPGIAVDDDVAWIKHKSELAAQWSFCDLECAITRADGQRDYYRISGAPVYNAAGAFTGFHGTGLDITASRRAAT